MRDDDTVDDDVTPVDADEYDTPDPDEEDVLDEAESEGEHDADDSDDAEDVVEDVAEEDVADPAPRRTRRRPAAARPASATPSLHFTMPKIDVKGWVTTARDGVANLSARPLTSFHMVVSIAVILTVFGLIMVLSASSVEGFAEQHSAYGAFFQQLFFAVLGWIMFYLALRLPIRFYRRFALMGVIISVALLVMVLIPGIGEERGGGRRWFDIAGISIQPSDIAKLALCIWGAHVLSTRRTVSSWGKELLLPLVPVTMLLCVLLILEPNQSTTMIMAIIAGALLWFAGLPGPVFAGFVASGLAAAVVLAFSAQYRAARVMSFLGGSDDPLGRDFQAMQAKYALANGGVFGVGLGRSTAKWNYLPNAHNDFIFAIIGEELGLIGALSTVGLFLLLAYVGMRIARRSTDPFLRLLTATITVLITTQMFINVGYVVGILPVTGIQLPLLSQGGTSMVTMLMMLGLMANAARHEPQAVAALAGTRPRGLARLLKLPAPTPYRPRAVDVAGDRLERRRTAAGRAPARSPERAPAGGRPRTRRAPAPAPARSLPPLRAANPRARGTRTDAQRSDEIHYARRRASTRNQMPGSPRRTEYRHR
ncbi:MAG: putative lipid II flippase FtsW [Gordonia sp. (in: high G+C Gram-positive bacteria)]|uniref:putative lipid II flippase FtsW n=1 Tax=Gordonia sp. (in: high G+C Gram-positive bacteria) TaxID=84139 RepID=UPI0039E6CE82